MCSLEVGGASLVLIAPMQPTRERLIGRVPNQLPSYIQVRRGPPAVASPKESAFRS